MDYTMNFSLNIIPWRKEDKIKETPKCESLLSYKQSPTPGHDSVYFHRTYYILLPINSPQPPHKIESKGWVHPLSLRNTALYTQM